ncbi:hypothetical protein OB955_18630 [Halobacteria archaeon AArc-m2/3/4]|uniref:PemK-like, MazF-like toxin of type II toxin-antitoxin system n=1 Tax=Natronoglomus mannanivorans TaxID=2979990 RepID=A0AAP2Z0C0_9EURY|nr:hypothetical protein [Halobacteria archaeon AArc-xg1-1]MCU4974739.1 hypothetical protein [Halobacteria archaeon AArc-m2/3/4]
MSDHNFDHERGEVVWYPALFADYDRPFLIVSTDDHPFYRDEYVALSITTTDLEASIRIGEDDWVIGELPKESHVKPWNPAIVKADEILSVAGAVTTDLVDRAVDDLASICGRGPEYER